MHFVMVPIQEMTETACVHLHKAVSVVWSSKTYKNAQQHTGNEGACLEHGFKILRALRK